MKKNKNEGDKKAAIEINKPSIERKIKDLNDEIQQTNIALLEKTLQLGFELIQFLEEVNITSIAIKVT